MKLAAIIEKQTVYTVLTEIASASLVSYIPCEKAATFERPDDAPVLQCSFTPQRRQKCPSTHIHPLICAQSYS